ncbi:MAG: LLM class F420-dependent oxidoreductase [Acidimicrobiales bacterium]
MEQRWGITVPLAGASLVDQAEWVRELPDLGFTDLWSAEVDGTDALTPLVLAAQWAPTLRLGTAIVPVYTRGPALLAQSTGAMGTVAPGRFVLGIGSSSNVIVERWNGIEFDRPYQRVRDTLRFLRAAMGGEKVTEEYETFAVRGFRLGAVPPEPVPILLAALRPGMLHLAGREADGAITNWLAPSDVAQVAAALHETGPGKELAARVFVLMTDDADTARGIGRQMINAYLNVPVYAAFHEWLGRGDQLRAMWGLWAAGDRKAAAAAIPDAVVDDLIVWGSPEACRERVEAYLDAGITTPFPVVVPFGDPMQAVRALARR